MKYFICPFCHEIASLTNKEVKIVMKRFRKLKVKTVKDLCVDCVYCDNPIYINK